MSPKFLGSQTLVPFKLHAGFQQASPLGMLNAITFASCESNIQTASRLRDTWHDSSSLY